MAEQTLVENSELGNRPREFKVAVDIDSPFDGQIIIFDGSADWPFDVLKARARTLTGEIDIRLQIDGADISDFDPWSVVSGALQEQEPGDTGGAFVALTQQFRALLEIPSGATTPSGLHLEVLLRSTQENPSA